MKELCPFCHWWLRKLYKLEGIYECSNPVCNTIIEHVEKDGQPKIKPNIQSLKQYQEQIKKILEDVK